MKRAAFVCMVLILLAGCFTGCQNNTGSSTADPSAKEPQPTIAGTPTTQAPKETEPEIPPEPIAPQGAIINNMILKTAVGEQAEQTVENPLASHIYNYIINQRNNSEEKRPSDSNEEYEKTVIHLTFTVGEKRALHLYLYEDDYAAIDISAGSEGTSFKYFKFTDGAYGSVLLTLQEK